MTTLVENKVKMMNAEVVETMKFNRIVVKLYKLEDETYYWQGFLNGRFVIASTAVFTDPFIAKKDIRSCFL